MGMSNPEIKPLTDMFSKRKENVDGENICLLAIATRKCYLELFDESEKMKSILKSCMKKLLSLQVGYISHNSIDVAVPGR